MLLDNPVTGSAVLDKPASSTSSVVNVELVDTCTWYDVAPEDAFQLSVSEVGWLVALLGGDAATGTVGAATIVVKLQGKE